MNKLNNIFCLFFVAFVLMFTTNIYAHSVQVAYGVNCNGDLRIFVEHWHNTEDYSTTTMNIQVNIGGVITSIVGSPNGGIQDTPINDLPGSVIPIVSFIQSSQANTYNDWVWYDFPGVPSGVPVIITIQSGNTVFTEGSGGNSVQYPASSQSFILPSISTPTYSSMRYCGGANTTPILFTDGSTTWTNNNPNIGLATSGVGDIPSFVASSNTTQQIATITVASECYTTSFNYTIDPQPNASFSIGNYANGVFCRQFGIPFSLTNQSNIASAFWSFGDGSNASSVSPITHTYSTNGVYTVNVNVTSTIGSCTATSSSTLSVYTPTANFTTTNHCLGLSSAFNNLSLAPVNLSSQIWNYRDGSSGMGNNPSHTYNNPGTYTIQLLISDINGCKDSIEKSITVYPNPVVSFSATSVCYNVPTNFSNTTTILSPDNISSWQWDFNNDGNTDNTTQNPIYLYPTAGTHTAILTATSNNACTRSHSLVVTVNSNPTATFTPINACQNLNIVLNNTSFVPAPDNIVAWNWDFGADANIATSILPNPINIKYLTSGIKFINLEVIAQTGCHSTITQTVISYPDPMPNFTFTNTCINSQPFNFDASSSYITSGNITTYNWSFGDATSGNGSNRNHTYGAAQVYNVNLSLTSDMGCQKSIVKQIEVYEKPKVAILNSKACDGKLMTFTATPLPTSGSVVYWLWDFNNSIQSIESSGQTGNYTFNGAGNQTVALVSETNNGCKDTLYKQIYVNYLPVPDFSVDKPSGCPLPHSVIFTDNTAAIPAPASNLIWKWTFGDGTVINSTSNNQQAHNYNNTSSSQDATYDVKLTVTTSEGCVDSISKSSMITVYPKPIASFETEPNPTDVVTPLVYFTNTSLDYTNWQWYFGESLSQIDSITANPTHYYNSELADSYNTALIVKNQYGCRDTAYQIVKVTPAFTFYIPNAFTPGTDDIINQTFTGKGIGIEKFEMWIYDRWGSSLYYTNEIAKGWDGTVQGKGDEPVQQDVYVWKVKLKDVLGKQHNFVGHVTLLK